jgi:hypothetical protein
MIRKKAFSFFPALLFAVLFLTSCSGPLCKSNCGVNGGTGSVIVTVTSTPSQTFFFPFLDWVILEVDLINSTSTAIVVQGALPPADFARLQTDSQFLGINKTVPAGTYTSAKIHLKPSTDSSYFYNNSGVTLFNCTQGAVCKIPTTGVAGFADTTVTVPVSFTVTANNSGFSLNFDLSKAVTSAGGMTFDFTKAGAITLTTLPRVGQSSGSLDSLENFTGMITAKASTTIDMLSLSSGTRTIAVPSTAEFDDPFTVCTTGQANFTCLALNQNVSVDAVINSDGTLTAYEVEFLDKAPGATEIEGVIVAPVSSNQFKMVVTNGMPVSAGFLPGTLATVTVNGASSYFADPKNLGVSVSTTPTGFLGSGDLVVGQTVMLQGGTVNFTNNSLSGYTRTLLRYSSIGGTIQSVSGTIFTLSGLSPFFANLTTNTVQVQTFTNTTYDNVTAGNLAGGTNASVRGLYLNPNSGTTTPVLAAQVRTH